MATFERFEDIDAWKKARELTREIYAVANRGPFAKDLKLKGQIQAAVVSIMSNIAEGFDRGGTREFVQFLSISKGSVGEVQSHLFVAYDQRYINENEFLELKAKAHHIGGLIAGLISYLKRTKLKGSKYL